MPFSRGLADGRRLQKSYDDERGTSSSKGKGRAGNAAAPPRVMWVDKYRPKKFSDLLGEDVSQRQGARRGEANQVAESASRSLVVAEGMGSMCVQPRRRPSHQAISTWRRAGQRRPAGPSRPTAPTSAQDPPPLRPAWIRKDDARAHCRPAGGVPDLGDQCQRRPRCRDRHSADPECRRCGSRSRWRRKAGLRGGG